MAPLLLRPEIGIAIGILQVEKLILMLLIR